VWAHRLLLAGELEARQLHLALLLLPNSTLRDLEQALYPLCGAPDERQAHVLGRHEELGLAQRLTSAVHSLGHEGHIAHTERRVRILHRQQCGTVVLQDLRSGGCRTGGCTRHAKNTIARVW